MNKKISVCIPTFNGELFIRQAIESIVNQSWRNFELIISDDNSSDSTLEIIRRIYDPRIKIFRNNQRLGLVGNWNRCISLANCEYINLFHQDDIMAPSYLEKVVNVIDNNPEIGFVFSNILLIDSGGNTIGGHWSPVLDKDFYFNGAELFRLLLKNGNIIPCPTVLAKGKYYQQLGGFNPNLCFTPDMEMWLRLCLYCDSTYLDEPLVFIRRHSGQESSKYSGKPDEVIEARTALSIIFTHHKNQIINIREMKKIARDQLFQWNYWLLRDSLKRKKLKQAYRFLQLEGTFLFAQLIGKMWEIPLFDSEARRMSTMVIGQSK